jgi:hypothetical protein
MDTEALPEEQVRQWCLHELLRTYRVPVSRMKVEWTVKVARERRPHRIDILVTRESQPYIVVECKARANEDHAAAMQQAVNYASLPEVGAEFAVYTNGTAWQVRRRVNGHWIEIPDLPEIGDDHPCVTEWRDVLLSVNRLSPILHWLDRVVPAKFARAYFEALQTFFNSHDDITTSADHKLVTAADNLLRVLCRLREHEAYKGGKLTVACGMLDKYWRERHPDTVTGFDGNDMHEMAHNAWADLSRLMEPCRDMVTADCNLLRLILVLLTYLQPNKGRSGAYRDVETDIQGAVRAYFDLALLVRFNARLPDPTDSMMLSDLHSFCKPAWQEHHGQFRWS